MSNNIYSCTPINGTAAKVTSQKGCTTELTPEQERESILDHLNQIENQIIKLTEGGATKKDPKRKKLGVRKYEFQCKLSELNVKLKRIGLGESNRMDFYDCVYDTMKEQLSNFQYKRIMNLARELHAKDLESKLETKEVK